MNEVVEYTALSAPQEACELPPDDSRVWVMRRHPMARLRQSHAIIAVDWDAGVARTSCGLGLRPDAIDDVPEGGCMPCVLCVAATPLPA